jgi:hypothetical protein
MGSRQETLDGKKLRALELNIDEIQKSIRKMGTPLKNIQIDNNNFINVFFWLAKNFDG